MRRTLRRTPSWRLGVRKLSDMKLTALIAIFVAARGTAGDAIAVQCPETSNGNVVIAHQFECSSFYLCDGSPKPSFLLRCPTGMFFGEEGTMGTGVVGGGCVQEAECRPQVDVNAVPVARGARALPPVDTPGDYRNYTMHLPNPANCSQFYRYEGDVEPQLFECPSGLGFDSVLESCDSKATCRSTSCQHVSPPVCPPNNEELVHLPHPTDCTKFYKCNWGNPVLFDCPDNLYFNPIIQVCDWPRNVPCDRCSPGDHAKEVTDEEVPDDEGDVPDGELTGGEGRIDARLGRQNGGRTSSSSPGGRQTAQDQGRLPGREGGQSAGYANKGGRAQTTATGVQPNYRGQEDRQGYQPSNQGNQQPQTGYQAPVRSYQPTNRQQPGYPAEGQGFAGTNQDYQPINHGRQPSNPSQGYQPTNQGYQPTYQGRQPGNPSQGYQPTNQGRQPDNPSQGYQPTNQGYQPTYQGRQPDNPSQGYQPTNQGYQPTYQGRQPDNPSQGYQPTNQGRQPGSRQQPNQGDQPPNRAYDRQQPGQEQGRPQPGQGSRSLQGHREYGSTTQIQQTVDGYPLYQPDGTTPPRSQHQPTPAATRNQHQMPTVPPRNEYQPRPTPPARRYLTAPQGEQGGIGHAGSYQPVITMAPIGRYQPDDQTQAGTRSDGQRQASSRPDIQSQTSPSPGSQSQGEPRWVNEDRPAPGPRVQMKPTTGIGGRPQYYQPAEPEQSIDDQGRQPTNAQSSQWYDSQGRLLNIAQGRQTSTQSPSQANASPRPPPSRDFHSVRVYHSESSTTWPPARATTPLYGQDSYRSRDPYQPLDQDADQGPDSGIEQVSYAGGHQDPDEQLYGNSVRPQTANQRGGTAQQHLPTQQPAITNARAHQRPQGSQYATSPQPEDKEDYDAQYNDETSQIQTRSVGSQMPGPVDLHTRPVGSSAARSSEIRAEPPRPVYQHVMRIPTPNETGKKV